jgi:hypothetical protein
MDLIELTKICQNEEEAFNFPFTKELFFRDSVMFNQSFLGNTPESLYAVNVDLPLLEFMLVVDVEMLVSAEHERVISPPFIGIHD